MKKARNFIVPFHIYPFDCMFSYGQPDKELRAELEKYLDIERMDLLMDACDLGSSYGLACRLWDGGSFLIRLKGNPVTPKFHATVNHEIFHVVHGLFNGVGMNLSDDSEEAYAYLIGYLTQQFYINFNTK